MAIHKLPGEFLNKVRMQSLIGPAGETHTQTTSSTEFVPYSVNQVTIKNYINGGITWTFNHPFAALPVISTAIELKNLSNSIYPLSVKIVELTTSHVIINVYKEILSETDIVFSECNTDDVIVHIRAGVS